MLTVPHLEIPLLTFIASLLNQLLWGDSNGVEYGAYSCLALCKIRGARICAHRPHGMAGNSSGVADKRQGRASPPSEEEEPDSSCQTAAEFLRS
jgi:hypothetical protein